MTEAPRIYQALLEAMKDIAEAGIAKDSKNKDQGYNFRGIEAAMNALAPILIKHKIVVTPSYSDHAETERETKSGGRMKFVKVKGTFRFVSAEDGSSVESVCWGEAFDTSDKATTKAQSVAFRTALFQTFVVPTQATAIDPEGDGAGDGDPDIGKLLEAHKRELRLLQTDKEALHYWNSTKGEFASYPSAYAEFKDATVAHRKSLSAKTTGATA